jgi:hypothetical protein
VKGALIVLRSVLVINFLLFALSFIPYVEGSGNAPGIMDQIFPAGNGFRPDFLWLILSTICIGASFVASLYSQRLRSEYRSELLFSALWIVAFIVYVARALNSGTLWFG